MVEKLIEQEGLLMNTPFLQRIREEAREESRQQAYRQAILNALVLRFDPIVSVYREIEKSVTKINDDALLDHIFAAAIKTATLAEFQETLRQVTTPAEPRSA